MPIATPAANVFPTSPTGIRAMTMTSAKAPIVKMVFVVIRVHVVLAMSIAWALLKIPFVIPQPPAREVKLSGIAMRLSLVTPW